ncbi:MAG: hypothetical protein ACI8PG_005405, partial [Planctomycetota bacterium]
SGSSSTRTVFNASQGLVVGSVMAIVFRADRWSDSFG